MRTETLSHLRCPLCREPLAVADTGDTAAARALRCPRRHSFDIARQGYVNLLAGRAPHAGDSGEMVAARNAFLGAGHYDFVSTAVVEAAQREITRITAEPATAEPGEPATAEPGEPATAGPGGAGEPARAGPGAPAGRGAAGTSAATYAGLVVDVGAGTGRHLAAVLDALPAAAGLAVDVSKPALRRAARAHRRADAALCDTWRPLPLADGSAALLLDVFAPRNGAEFRRVLRPDGALLVVTPAEDHLAELVGGLGLLRVDPDKAGRVAGSLAGHFDLVDRADHRRALALARPEVRTLVGMGPSAWHADPDRLAERIEALPEPVTVTASVRLAVYHPR
jgi:23S rRNA (guanine745-N1)-methyltransferase